MQIILPLLSRNVINFAADFADITIAVEVGDVASVTFFGSVLKASFCRIGAIIRSVAISCIQSPSLMFIWPTECRLLKCSGSVSDDGEPVEGYEGPLTYFITDSTDTGAAAGPLYVTKRALDDSTYEFGFAEVCHLLQRPLILGL